MAARPVNQIAAGAPVNAQINAGNPGIFGALPAVVRAGGSRTQCLANGAIGLGALVSHRKTASPVPGLEWPNNVSVHATELFQFAWMLTLAREAVSFASNATRGYAKGCIFGRAMTLLCYVVQAIVRYRLDT